MILALDSGVVGFFGVVDRAGRRKELESDKNG